MAMLAGLVAVGMLAAGCGSGDGDRLTKAEFIKQADAMCKRVLKDAQTEYFAALRQSVQAGKEGPGGGEGRDPNDILVDYYRTKTARLADLSPPGADEARIQAMLDALDAAIKEGEKDPTIFAAGTAALKKERRIAKEYGIKECARF
jgi:hypothetical protein